MFQDFRLINNMTVYDNVAFAMRVIGARESEIRERVPYVLELVGLENKAGRHPGEMSGGEQQRLAIARALVNNPSTIIADRAHRQPGPGPIASRSCRCCRRSTIWAPLFVVTHEKNLVELFAKRVIAIDDGYVVSDGREGYYNDEIQ